MTVRKFAIALMLTLVSTGAFAQTTPQQPPQPPATPDEPVVYEEQVVVTASKVEQQLVNAPATVSVVTADVIALDSGDQLRRVVPIGARRQPVADFRARLQHHDARRFVDAGDIHAGAA